MPQSYWKVVFQAMKGSNIIDFQLITIHHHYRRVKMDEKPKRKFLLNTLYYFSGVLLEFGGNFHHNFVDKGK